MYVLIEIKIKNKKNEFEENMSLNLENLHTVNMKNCVL